LRAALERRRFFARPKLALDCVGGASAARLAHCLQDNGVLVVFGCMSGRAVTLPWTTLVARGLSCRGFSLRKWMDKAGDAKIARMFETVAKLVGAGELVIPHCEYEMSSELAEAVEHAAERRKEVKVVLRVDEVGDTYE
jgi:trans-2-enoyl-CoA reductase